MTFRLNVLGSMVFALSPTEVTGSHLIGFGRGGVAARSAIERDVMTESAIFAPRDDIGPQRAPPLTTKRIQVDASEGKHATER